MRELLRIVQGVTIELVGKIDQERLGVSRIADKIIDQPQLQELAGEGTFRGVLDRVLGWHEGTGAAGGMTRDNYQAAGVLCEGCAKDQLD